MKCLVVDDDEFFRVLHKEMLSSICDCDVATDGNEAAQMFLNAMNNVQPYDFICMDVQMPVCDGHEALIKIRTIEKDQCIDTSKQVKIIMLSTSNDPKTVMESYYKGGTSYLVKPITKVKLLQVLKNFKLIT